MHATVEVIIPIPVTSQTPHALSKPPELPVAVLTDCSRNGTVVGQRRLHKGESAPLAVSTVIRVGTTCLVLESMFSNDEEEDVEDFDCRGVGTSRAGAPHDVVEVLDSPVPRVLASSVPPPTGGGAGAGASSAGVGAGVSNDAAAAAVADSTSAVGAAGAAAAISSAVGAKVGDDGRQPVQEAKPFAPPPDDSIRGCPVCDRDLSTMTIMVSAFPSSLPPACLPPVTDLQPSYPPVQDAQVHVNKCLECKNDAAVAAVTEAVLESKAVRVARFACPHTSNTVHTVSPPSTDGARSVFVPDLRQELATVGFCPARLSCDQVHGRQPRQGSCG